MGQEQRWPFGNCAQVIAKEGRAHSCWANEAVTTHESTVGGKEKSGSHKKVDQELSGEAPERAGEAQRGAVRSTDHKLLGSRSRRAAATGSMTRT